MPYKVGISTGWWRIAKAPELLGMAAKIAYGATAGVTFVQVDLETTSEFLEPGLDYQVKRVNELGMEVGVHAEIGEVMALESAEWRLWDQSQRRLCETLRHAADLGFIYVNIHLSTKPQLLHEESRFRVFGYQFPVVSFDGKPLSTICDKIPEAKSVAIKNLRRTGQEAFGEVPQITEALEKRYRKLEDDAIKQELANLQNSPEYKNLPPDQRRGIENQIRTAKEAEFSRKLREEMGSNNFVYDCWKNAHFSRYVLDNSEIGAYEIVAQYMNKQNDPLWTNICGGNPEDVYINKHPEYNAALAAKYIEGHLTSKWHEANQKMLDGMSMKEFCEKRKIYLLFETPEASEGQEGIYRLFSPLHAYHMIRKLNSPYVRLCIDFEHMLAHKMEPDKIIPQMASDAGKQILLFHLGTPIPYFGTAHVPIPRGSHAQEHIYRWLWMLKQKGFDGGYMIYERGGGNTTQEVVRDSVQTLRLIANELDEGTNPNELPASFYGISEQNEAVFARQRVTMRDHFMDPIAGLVTIPEETHTFLSRAAVEKGKAEEWRKGRYR